MSNELIVRNSIHIDASPEKVWDALTNPAITPKYMFNCAALTTWQTGAPLKWRGVEDGIDYVVGTVGKVEPYKTLEFSTYDPNGALDDIPENYIGVTYTLTPDGDGTRLDVEQGDFAKAQNGQERYDHTVQGWGMTMEGLKKVVEG